MIKLFLILLFKGCYCFCGVCPWTSPAKRYINGLLAKHKVKLTGNWSAFFVCIWTETELRSMNLEKSQPRQISSLNEQAWSMKYLLHENRTLFSCGLQWVIPSGQDCAMLPIPVANHNAVFASSYRLTEVTV